MAGEWRLDPPVDELRTERLLLRRWRDHDRELFAALNADFQVMEHFPAPLTREESDAVVDRIEERFAAHGFGLWAVEVVEAADGGGLAGFVGLNPATFEAPFTPAIEVGWRLARWAWGRGYATEAAVAALDVAFRRVGVDEVVSFTATGNARSRAVMERLGLVHDESADFDHPALPEGHPLRRHVLYRMNRSRWREVRPPLPPAGAAP